SLISLIAYNMLRIGLYGVFWFAASKLIMVVTGNHLRWWLTALAGWLIVALLGVRSIDVSAKALGVVVALEFLVVTVVDVMALGIAADGVAAAAVQPDEFSVPVIGVLFAFGIGAVVSFDAGAVY